MIVRDDALKQTVSAYLVDRIYSAKNVEVLINTEVIALIGEKSLEAITLKNRKIGEEHTVRWLFVCIGGSPHTEWAADLSLGRICSTAATPHPTGLSIAVLIVWKRISLDCSRPATCATARLSAVPPQWAKAPWLLRLCTAI